MSWTLADIRTEVRDLIGRPSTNQISNAEINARINTFYRNDFVRDCPFEEFKYDFVQSLSATDSGEYSLSSDYITFREPAWIDNLKIHLTFDREFFFDQNPEDEDFITAPSLAIGVASAAAVKVSSFSYIIENYSYASSGTEKALAGSNLPTGKWGAWLVEIQTDGTLVITGASLNSTGYASAGLAVEGLPDSNNAYACVGYVVIYNATGAAFVPGTTLLSAAGLTVTYTDGDPALRNTPTMALIHQRKLFVRPRSSDIHQFKCHCGAKKPAALTLDTDIPLNEDWGQAIAYGTAIKFKSKKDQLEGGSLLPGLYDRELSLIRQDYYHQLQQREIVRSF